MLKLLLAKILFAGYNRKIEKIELSDLTGFQKAVLLARYYLPKQKILIALNKRGQESSRALLKNYLDKLYTKAVAELNKLINSDHEFFFSDFAGLKLDRQIAKKSLKFIFGLSINLLTKLIGLLEKSFRSIKKLLLRVNTN